VAQSLQEIWQQAQYAQKQGDLERAETLHKQIVGRKPDALASWQFLSARAASRGDFAKSAHAIRNYLKVDNLSAEGWRSLGVAEMQQGRFQEAVKALKEALKLQPGALANLVYLGGAAQQAGQDDLAADCLSLALQGMPVADILSGNGKAEPMLRAILTKAPAFLEGYVADLVFGDIAHDGALEGARWRFHETGEPVWNDPMQRPERFFLPALPPQAWFDGADLPWAKAIEDAYEDIRAEVQAALSLDDATPYIAAHMAEAEHWKEFAGNMDWSAIHLYNGGTPNDRVLEKFPKTMAALEPLPLCRTGDRPVEVFFSLLQPGMHIVPHFGTSNARLTVHLPIIVPEGSACALRAGDETRVMEAGKLMAFDDTFEHEAWNRSDGLRVNLIFEVWNPALTEEEQQETAAIMDRYDKWFSGRGRRMDFLGTTFAQAAQAEKLFQAAEQGLRAGDGQALGSMKQVLALSPKHKKALRYLADNAFDRGQESEGLEYLRRLAAEAPTHAPTQYRLAVVEEQIGMPERARDAYARCIKAAPGNMLSYLYAGYFFEAQGDSEAAAQVYSLGAEIDARMTTLHGSPDAEPETARRSKAAFDSIATKMLGLHAGATKGVPRIEEAKWVQHLEGFSGYREADQKPHEFYIPGIRPLRYLTRGDMLWADAVEAAFDDIRAELLAALPHADEAGRPYLDAGQQLGPEFDPINGTMNWTALDLYRDGKPNEALLKSFPKTLAALGAAPLVCVGDEPFEVFFSLLKPHQHIPPHFGLSNHGITVHLPLIVPKDCQIRVGQEWRPWVEGELIAFDDSFDHEARNDSDDLRVVLIFEVWHPDLTGDEVEAVRASFRARAQWLQARRLPEVLEDGKE
jgi:aspartyl/asparaginyl beta-hydroxylase (cupin superfamily)/Flp pilus assembly protein TadD